jgi:nucleoid-associated protein YgaU
MTAAIRSIDTTTGLRAVGGVRLRPFPTPRRRDESVYRRRRAVVGVVSAVLIAVASVATHDVLAGSGGVPASAAVSLPARTSVVAQPGDTLWSIASAHHGEASLTRYLDSLVDLNGGASIQPGQLIVLP